jgi:hypothetical protein
MTNPIAAESWGFWRPLVRLPLHAWALLGSEEGETSMRPHVVGDHGEAFGIAQWHGARADAILKGCGIDVRTASHADQLRAQHWEMTEGSYRRVWPALMAAETLWSAVTVLVAKYEQSGSQARDIQRRVGLAEGWAKVFPG